MSNAVIAILCAAMCTGVFSEQPVIGKMGTLEFGGSGGLSLVFPDDNYIEQSLSISLSPILNYFPINGLYFGPICSFGFSQSRWDNGDKIKGSSGSFGGKIGFVFDLNQPVLPYGEAGAAVDLMYYNRVNARLDTPEEIASDRGFCFPLTGGIKIPVTSQMTINADGTMKIKTGDVDPGISVYFGFGLTGHVPMRF